MTAGVWAERERRVAGGPARGEVVRVVMVSPNGGRRAGGGGGAERDGNRGEQRGIRLVTLKMVDTVAARRLEERAPAHVVDTIDEPRRRKGRVVQVSAFAHRVLPRTCRARRVESNARTEVDTQTKNTPHSAPAVPLPYPIEKP